MPEKTDLKWAGVIVVAVTLLHLLVAGLAKYGVPRVMPRKSEISVELGVSQPRTSGGTAPASAPAVPAKAVKKQTTQHQLPTPRVSEPAQAVAPIPAPTTASNAASSQETSTGAASIPTPAADHPVAYLQNPKPLYPREALQHRIEGTVRLKALVQADGTCSEVLLAHSSGHESLDRAALETVTQWKFKPARSQGKDAAQWVNIPITFSLKPR